MQTAFTDAVTLEIALNDKKDYSQTLQDIELKSGFKAMQLTDNNKKNFMRLWYKCNLGKLPKQTAFIGLLHSQYGNMYKIVLYRRGNGFLISFNGLQQYKREQQVLNDTARFMRLDLKALLSSGLSCTIKALDLCLDSTKPFNIKVPNKRTPNNEKTNICFYDTKQKEKERYIKLYEYNKQIKDKLDYLLFRIEAKFLAHYFITPKSSKQIKKSFEKIVGFKVKLEWLF